MVCEWESCIAFLGARENGNWFKMADGVATSGRAASNGTFKARRVWLAG